MKDAKVIAQLVKDGRYSMPTLPEGVYAELCGSMHEASRANDEKFSRHQNHQNPSAQLVGSVFPGVLYGV